MRDGAVRPIGRITKPRGEPFEVVDKEGLTLAQTLEERAAADDDRCDARQRLAAEFVYLCLIGIGHCSQSVLICVIHDPSIGGQMTHSQVTSDAMLKFVRAA